MLNAIITSCLLSTGISAVAPDSSHAVNELDDAYNLGRITGTAFMDAGMLYARDGIALAINGAHYQTGKQDNFSFGQTYLAGVVLGDDNGVIAMIPELDFNAALGPSNRISCVVLPTNFYMTYGGSAQTGFDYPFYMINAYRWDYLSNRGKIILQPEQLENAFYFRPLNNKGQARLTTNVLHTIGPGDYPNPRMIHLAPEASFGILDNLQADGAFLCKKYKWRKHPYYGDPYYNPYPYPYLYKSDTTIALGSINFRSGSLSTHGGYKYFNQALNHTKSSTHTAFLGGAYLLGSRGMSIGQVRGNWDGYFTPVLGARQLLTEAQLDCDIGGDRQRNRGPQFLFQNGIHYGLMRYCSIGERMSIRAGNMMKPRYTMLLDAAVMNIPLREQGPSEVSSFEYLFGYRPKSGQIRVDCISRVPIQKDIIDYYEIPSLLEYVSSESVLGMAMTNLDNATALSSELDGVWTDPVASKLKTIDFLFKVSIGLSEAIVLSNTFESRTDRYLYAIYPMYYYPHYPYDPTSDTEVLVNTIYADSFGLSVANSGWGAVTMIMSLIGQTDKHVEGREKFDFLLSLLYQGAF